MTAIFRDCISRFVHVYLDNIFIYSRSIKEHKKHLGIVFQWLRDHHLFLSKSKVDIYSKRLECLYHIIDDRGIHVDADKMQCIKTLACKAPILKPIDYDNPDPIWVITDGSKAGVGAIYGQGHDWKTCQPAGFMSKKFSNAQQHY